MTETSPGPATPDSPSPTTAPGADMAAEVSPEASERSRIRRSMIILALIAMGIYLQTLNYKLIYDAHFLIEKNASMTAVQENLGAAFNLFAQEYWTGVNADQPELLKIQGQGLYRPLGLFMWGVIYGVFGGGATWPYHLLNLLAHAGVVVFMYRVVQKLFDNQRLAFVAALIYALHPLHSEAVASVAGLHDILSTLAMLVGLYCFVVGRNARGALSTGAWIGMLAALFIGLLAKEQAVLLIPVVALTDFMWSRRGHPLSGMQRLLVYGGMLLMVGFHVLVRYSAVGYLSPRLGAAGFLDNPLLVEPFDIRLMNGLFLMAKRVWLFLWPEFLSGDYSYNAIPLVRSFLEPEALAGAVLVATMTLFGLVSLRRWPAMGWGVLFWIGCAAFTANIVVPIGTILAERLSYLPTVGASVAVAAVLDRVLLSRSKAAGTLSPIALLLMVALSAALAMRTIARNDNFATTRALFESAVEVVPDSARVHYQLGALASRDELYSFAEPHLQMALQIMPTFLIARIELGDLYQNDKNYDKAVQTYEELLYQLDATDEYQLVMNQTRQMVLLRLANARSLMGDMDAAEQELERLIEVSGDDVIGLVSLAELKMNREQYEEALPILQRALDKKPGNQRALYMQAQAAQLTGNKAIYDQAMAALSSHGGENQAFALAAEAEATYLRAAAESDDDLRQEALRMFDEARTLDATLVAPYLYRGRYLAETGRHFDAILEYDRALESHPRHPGILTFKVYSQLALNNPQDAVMTLGRLENVSPDADCYTLMAETYFMLGDIELVDQALSRLDELGVDPVDIVVKRVRAHEAVGDFDRAITIVNETLGLEDYRENPVLLKSLGILHLANEQPAEALAVFEREEASLAAASDAEPDLYLPINKARALMELDRDVEAADQLERFEQSVSPEDTLAWPSLLRWRAVLFLRNEGPFYDPEQALSLCDEGLVRTQRRYPPFFDRSIEAFVAMGDLEQALQRTREALAPFPGSPHYQVTEEALGLALGGDVPGAVAALRDVGDESLDRIADKLEFGAG